MSLFFIIHTFSSFNFILRTEYTHKCSKFKKVSCFQFLFYAKSKKINIAKSILIQLCLNMLTIQSKKLCLTKKKQNKLLFWRHYNCLFNIFSNFQFKDHIGTFYVNISTMFQFQSFFGEVCYLNIWLRRRM